MINFKTRDFSPLIKRVIAGVTIVGTLKERCIVFILAVPNNITRDILVGVISHRSKCQLQLQELDQVRRKYLNCG